MCNVSYININKEQSANSDREKRSVVFVTGHLFIFFLSHCLVTIINMWQEYVTISVCSPLNVENISRRRNSFAVSLHLATKWTLINRLKRSRKLVRCCFSNIVCYLILKSPARSVNTMKAWNSINERILPWFFLKNKTFEEVGQEYSPMCKITAENTW